MKQKAISSLLVSGLLALSLAGCANGAGSTSSSQETADSSIAASADSSAADGEHASSASDDASSAASSLETGAPTDAPTPPTGQDGSTPPDLPDGEMGQGGPGQGGPGQGGSGQGGMMGNAMDTQPGQTTDKGYTATDSGIAISATLTVSEAFTDRDLEQTVDTASAQTIELTNGKDVTITEEGVYVVSGTASEATIYVDAADTAKVQIVLDGASITNTDAPAIYVKSADKVFVTLVGDNSLTVTGEFAAEGDSTPNAVVYSKDDLCFNGTGNLTIDSSDNAIECKDDLKVTGGSYTIKAVGAALKANDSVRIADGNFTITAEDGIKAKNDDDNELGYIYIKGGSFEIDTTDNGIQGYAFVWIDGGSFDISGEECIEGTYIQINDGTFTINASDDAINASIKSSVYTPTIEINGGTLDITMAAGDTDALDSNGYLYINGGTVNISAQSPFDYAWGGAINGGEVTVNGEKVTELYDSMMGGGMGGPGGMGGDQDGPGRQGGKRPEGGMGSGPMGGTPPSGGPGEQANTSATTNAA